MSERTVRFCDECGADRTPAVNHWWSVTGDPTKPRFVTYAEAELATNEQVRRWDFCSHKCLTTVFQRYLNEGSVLKAETPKEQG